MATYKVDPDHPLCMFCATATPFPCSSKTYKGCSIRQAMDQGDNIEPQFKPGQLVHRRNGKPFSNGANTVTIDKIIGANIWLKETSSHCTADYIKPAYTRGERQTYEVKDDMAKKPTATDDKVYKPNHYAKWAIEPITFIMRNKMEFWRGNIIKYATRAGSKSYDGMDAVQSEITDLEKVRRYAEMRINELKGETIL